MRKEAAIAAPPHRVAIVIDHGLSPFEFSVACEVFAFPRPQLGNSWYETVICAPDPRIVRTDLGFSVHGAHSLRAMDRADTVVVAPVGTNGGRGDPRVIAALRRAHARGARIASLCTGAFILAEAGLLDGRHATTHWRHASSLAQQFPSVMVDPRVLYIDEGDVLTSAGSAASIDLCLHLVRSDYGAEVANAVARAMVVPPHRDGGQAQYVEMPVPDDQGVDTLADTLRWAQEHLDATLCVEMLAARAAMSPRTFARKFGATTGTTPKRWILRQRVLFARRLLETTDHSIDYVAGACGLGTAANLRQHFATIVGVAPAAYRRTFRGQQPAA